MSNFGRRALLAGAIPLALLAACSPDPEVETVERPLPPEEVEVTAKADPINNKADTGGEEEPAQQMNESQTNEAINQLNVGVLTWGNQRSDETDEERSARMKGFVMDGSSAAGDVTTPLIVNPEDGAEEHQTTSCMIRGVSVVSTTATSIIADFNLEVVPEFATVMEDGSQEARTQGSTYNYNLRVTGEWGVEQEKWLITSFAQA